jgi:hypothetical protein
MDFSGIVKPRDTINTDQSLHPNMQWLWLILPELLHTQEHQCPCPWAKEQRCWLYWNCWLGHWPWSTSKMKVPDPSGLLCDQGCTNHCSIQQVSIILNHYLNDCDLHALQSLSTSHRAGKTIFPPQTMIRTVPSVRPHQGTLTWALRWRVPLFLTWEKGIWRTLCTTSGFDPRICLAEWSQDSCIEGTWVHIYRWGRLSACWQISRSMTLSAQYTPMWV